MSNLEDLKHLKEKLILWWLLYGITSSSFLGGTSYLTYMTFKELLNGGHPVNFFVGNQNNFILCFVLLIISVFFFNLKNKTKNYLDKKAEDIIESS